jgi:hypothetical protein
MVNVIEVVYVDGGQEYRRLDGSNPDQPRLFEADPDAPVVSKRKKIDGKRFLIGDFFDNGDFTTEANGRGFVNIQSRGYDLCPDVDTWLGIGLYGLEGELDPGFHELYFWARSSELLRSVSEYYDLPYPIEGNVSNDIDHNPELIALTTTLIDAYTVIPIVCASIRFRDDLPTLLKLYTHRKIVDE